MDLFCPHCTQRVTVSDAKSGQVTDCPQCGKAFMAPTLTPPAPPKPPEPPSAPKPVETFSVGPAPAPPPPIMTSATAPPSPEPAAPPPPPLPPPPPGEYTKSFALHLRAEWLAFVPVVCVFVLFILSFFTWHLPVHGGDSVVPQYTLWGLAFSAVHPHFIAYIVMLILSIPLNIFVLIVDKGLIPPVSKIVPLMVFKNLLVGAFLGLAFLFLLYDYVSAHFAPSNPLAIAEKLAFRVHLLAIVVCFLMTWLNWRNQRNLPPPRLEGRW